MLPSLRNPLARLHAAHLPAALHRLLLYSTTTASASPFAVEDYLFATCGLTPPRARRACKYLSHVKSPDNPDAVCAFLTGIGLSKSDLASVIAMFPRILCYKVDRALIPCVADLRGVGLSPSEISRLVIAAPNIFFGSLDRVRIALRRNRYLFSGNLELVVKPNLAFLQQCGLWILMLLLAKGK